MNFIKIFIYPIIGLFLIACEQKEDVVTLSGNLSGFVQLIDESGKILDNNSGVIVSFENTSYSAITDTFGKFNFTGIPSGTYNIVYKKEGYGTSKLLSYLFIGGNVATILRTCSIYQLPSIKVTQFSISFKNGTISVKGKTNKNVSNYSILFLFNDSSNVSMNNFDFSFTSMNFAASVYEINEENRFEHPFKIGQKVYGAVYLKNEFEEVRYDAELRNYIFSTYVQSSDIVTCTVE